jgi:hypothetical protein
LTNNAKEFFTETLKSPKNGIFMDETMDKINIVFATIAIFSLILSTISIGVTYTLFSLYHPSTFQDQTSQTDSTPDSTLTPTPTQTQTAQTTTPKITSVSPITDAENQTIIIQGDGFGDISPTLESLGDGSVDTIWGITTPSIVILDETNLLSAGAAGDWSGFTNGPPDLIGIRLQSWNNTCIVLGGFGTGLNSQFSWSQINKGDSLQVQIQTIDGLATYNTTVS